MKKRFNITYIPLLWLLLLACAACSREDLKDFESINATPTTVGSGKIAGNIVKTNDQLIVPLSIKLASPATKAFEVGLAVDQEAAAEHISKNSLGSDYVAVAPQSVILPNASKVQFGSDSTVFDLKITRTEVEKYFGKNIVIGYKITEAGKGNTVDGNKAIGIIILDTEKLLVEEDIHFLSLSNGAGEILVAKSQVNYESASSGMSIPIGVTLASFPGASFTAEIKTSTDTIAKLIQAGLLPANTVALTSGQYTIPSKVQVASNARSAKFSLDIPWSVIAANVTKQLAIMVEISNPTLHVVNPTKGYTILLIDSENVIEVDVTNQGVFSVNKDNSGGANANEGSLKLIDGNYNSKFLTGNFIGDQQFKLVYSTPQKIGAYTWTSGNDATERDPNAWFLEGSDDGITWTTIDTRQNEAFTSRNQTRRFDIDLPKAYKQFRMNITSNVGANLLQISEWRMIRIP